MLIKSKNLKNPLFSKNPSFMKNSLRFSILGLCDSSPMLRKKAKKYQKINFSTKKLPNKKKQKKKEKYLYS